MKVKTNLFSLSKNLDSLLAAMFGFFLIQIFSRHSGIGVSPDSVTYIAATRHMVHGMGFNSFDNLPVVDFPFAYPFFLTIISFLSGLDPLQFGPWLNGILFGILLYVSGSIINGFEKKSGWNKRILLCCMLLSPALQEVYSMLWSETVFLILILIFILSLNRYLKLKTKRWLWISAGICAITCLTRYAGVFLMLTGGTVLIFNKENSLIKRVMDCLIFGILSVPLLLINIIRNYLLTGLATGIRPKSEVGVLKIMEYFGDVLCDWLLLNRSSGLAVFLTILILLIFTFVIFYRRQKGTANSLEYIIAVSGLIYSAFMIFSYSITRYEPFTSRLLSPVYLFLLWSLGSWITSFISEKSYRSNWAFGIPVLLMTAWFLNKQLAADWEFYDGVKDAGVPGYQEDPFVQTEIVQFLKNDQRALNSSFPVYSNAGDAFYFVTGRPAFQLPFLDFPQKVEAYYNGYDNHRHEYLVWFQNEENLQMPALDTILMHKDMVPLKLLKDGAIYITR
ncbi:MAG TPA: hypothetical protein VGH64_06725 [Puia sp.]|jgi:hypothetical protein